jgi:plastocyanin
MKTLQLSIIIVLSIATFSISLSYAEQPLLDFYNNSQLVIVGKVISLSQVPTTIQSQDKNQTQYDIQVEEYYKNPQPFKLITVYGFAKGIYYSYDPTFDVGDRLFLYLKKDHGFYQIQPHSLKLNNTCDARPLIPLQWLPFENPPISTPAYGRDFMVVDSQGNARPNYNVGEKLEIRFDAANYMPVVKQATLEFNIKADNNTNVVFNETKQITIPPCNGHVPVSMHFVPQKSGAYTIESNMSGFVKLGQESVWFTEPIIGSGFMVNESNSQTNNPSSLLLPLKQFKSGISLADITCKEDFFLAISNEKNPICLKPETISKLASRGFFYGINSSEIKTNYITILIPPGSENVAANKTYSPNIVKVVIGVNNTVRWVNQADIGNSVVAYINDQCCDKMFDSSYLKPGQSYEFTFTQLGTYHYHGEPHPWQLGTVIVMPSQVSQKENSTSALKLYLSTNSDIIKQGQSIGITVSVNNTLSSQVMVQDENFWKLDNLRVNPCARTPYGIAIFDGFYSEKNMTDGKPLRIFDFDANCQAYIKTTQTYVFHPSSGHVTLNNCSDTQSTCSSGYDMGNQLSFTGTLDTGQIMPFNPGIYTIVGGDEWGHVAIEHFVVTNSTIFAGDLGTIHCPMMYGGVQFGATIKNLTGFANYYNSTQYGNTFYLHPGMQGIINVQYLAPANAAWFQNNDNTPLNITNGAALSYMESVTKNKNTISFAVSLYNDESGHHSRICHYGIQFGGGFAEPCNTDNTGDIPLGELPDASRLLHVGINTSYEPNSVILYPNSNPVFTATVSANSDAMPGTYWLSLERSLCGPGVLAKLVVLP